MEHLPSSLLDYVIKGLITIVISALFYILKEFRSDLKKFITKLDSVAETMITLKANDKNKDVVITEIKTAIKHSQDEIDLLKQRVTRLETQNEE